MRGAVRITWDVMLAIIIVVLMFLVVYSIIWQDVGSQVFERGFNIKDLIDFIFGLKS